MKRLCVAAFALSAALFAFGPASAGSINGMQQAAVCDPTTNQGQNCLKPNADGSININGGGSGGNVNLTGINGVTPLVGAGATGTGSPRTTQAQDTTTIAGSAPGTAGTPSAQVLTVQNPTSNRVRGHATSTDTSAHTLIAAGTTGIKTYITGIQCSRSDAGTTPITLTFSDDVSSTMDIPDAGNGGANNFVLTGSPLATAAATAFTFTSSSGVTTVKCNAQGFQGP
jgi:hypothetical protein